MQFDSLKVDEDISIHVQGPEEPIVYWNKRRSSGWKVEWSHAEAITIARRDLLGLYGLQRLHHVCSVVETVVHDTGCKR